MRTERSMLKAKSDFNFDRLERHWVWKNGACKPRVSRWQNAIKFSKMRAKRALRRYNKEITREECYG